ncbi:YHYH domain-containing protein [Methylibium sp.]|uniref:YHYH domain-containing protein n=1 Tax=Methylibium sp. TaxID=2067992 RepID=UPI003D0C7EDF
MPNGFARVVPGSACLRCLIGMDMYQRIALASLLAVAGASAHAHGGGLNAEGCHTNRKTGDYHCHRSPAAATPQRGVVPTQSAAPAQRLAEPAPTPTGPTYYVGPRGGTYTITKSGRKNYGGC